MYFQGIKCILLSAHAFHFKFDMNFKEKKRIGLARLTSRSKVGSKIFGVARNKLVARIIRFRASLARDPSYLRNLVDVTS